MSQYEVHLTLCNARAHPRTPFFHVGFLPRRPPLEALCNV